MNKPALKSPNEYLQNLRENWLLSEEAQLVLQGAKASDSSSCEISQVTWNQEIYSDFSGSKKIVVFEIWKKKLLSEEHHCIGCEIINNNYTLLTQEELWKEGIP